MLAARFVWSTPAVFKRATPTPKRRRRRQGGQSLVEFALVFPLFIAILFGIIDFGWLLYSRITVINATREATRWASVQAENSTAIPATVGSTGGPIRGNAQGLVNANISIAVSCIPETGAASCDFTAGNGTRDGQTGDSVRITTTYIYPSFFGRVFGATITFNSTSTMVLE